MLESRHRPHVMESSGSPPGSPQAPTGFHHLGTDLMGPATHAWKTVAMPYWSDGGLPWPPSVGGGLAPENRDGRLRL